MKVGDLEKDFGNLKEKVNVLKQENDGLHQRCDVLYQGLLQAEKQRKNSSDKLSQAHVNIEGLKKENSHLWKYIDKISEHEGFINCGKIISKVKERQQRKKYRS